MLRELCSRNTVDLLREDCGPAAGGLWNLRTQCRRTADFWRPGRTLHIGVQGGSGTGLGRVRGGSVMGLGRVRGESGVDSDLGRDWGGSGVGSDLGWIRIWGGTGVDRGWIRIWGGSRADPGWILIWGRAGTGLGRVCGRSVMGIFFGHSLSEVHQLLLCTARALRCYNITVEPP